MAVNATTGLLSPPVGSFLETYSGQQNGSASKPTYDDYSGVSSVGEDIPHYHRKLRRKELLPVTHWDQFRASGSYTGSRVYQSWSGSTLINTYTQTKPHTNNWTLFTTSQVACTEGRITTLHNDSLLDDAVTRAAVRLAASSHDTLTFLAELRQTVRMFRGALTRLLGNLSSANPRDWANMWLEGRYGWRTLLFDMQQIERSLRSVDRSTPFWKAVTDNQVSDSSHVVSEAPLMDGILINTTEEVWTIGYRGLATGRVAPPAFGGDIVTTAWELVPFSFVIDWFVNVGQKLSYVSHYMAQPETSLGVGLKIDITGTSTTTLDLSSLTGTGTYRWVSNYAQARYNAEFSYRAPRVPSLIPSLVVDLDAFKVMDLLALLIQRVSRH